MIGRLRGVLVHKSPPELLLDVQGVGYEVEAPLSTFYDLGEPGSEVLLLTHLVVRDDAHVLYGFATEAERRLFRALIKISGVGAKMALAVLSGIGTDEFAQCVERGDTAALTRLPGVGKKTAQRLIVEMRDRLESVAVGVSPGHAFGSAAHSPVEEAIQALVALGYRESDAARMVRAVEGADGDTEALIRAALQNTVKK
ncbi:MAG: Holliday junction branch migration protein RuvA [Gammaproteobacteria bacterium]|nr:Holliday junction branch migration protein RuvA [Gammaproteobacteria bacterium]